MLSLLALISVILLGLAYDYIGNKNQGTRFTHQDGVVLYILLDREFDDAEGDIITQAEIDSIYGDKVTDFRDYIEEKID